MNSCHKSNQSDEKADVEAAALVNVNLGGPGGLTRLPPRQYLRK